MVKTEAKGLYLEHSVAASQGLYSIGRIYNVNPKLIAEYNNIDFNKGLEIGQLLHIPLNDANFDQKTGKGVPVYYLPAQGEGLMKVSNQNKKVTLANLRTWNNLSGDNIRAGQKLIVGYLVSKEYKPQAPVIAAAPKTTADNATVKAEPVNQEVVQTQGAPIGSPKQETETTATGSTKNDPVKNDPVKSETANTDPAKTETAKQETVKPQPARSEPVKTSPAETRPESAPQPGGNMDEVKLSSEVGFFKTFFDQQVKVSPITKNNTVTSGIFKTSSGWQDSKYYLLIDGVATGTIVRVINPDNNKAIYAKVLGEMNGIRQNQGLGIRISNAAAAALGIREEEKFIVRVNY